MSAISKQYSKQQWMLHYPCTLLNFILLLWEVIRQEKTVRSSGASPTGYKSGLRPLRAVTGDNWLISFGNGSGIPARRSHASAGIWIGNVPHRFIWLTAGEEGSGACRRLALRGSKSHWGWTLRSHRRALLPVFFVVPEYRCTCPVNSCSYLIAFPTMIEFIFILCARINPSFLKGLLDGYVALAMRKVANTVKIRNANFPKVPEFLLRITHALYTDSQDSEHTQPTHRASAREQTRVLRTRVRVPEPLWGYPVGRHSCHYCSPEMTLASLGTLCNIHTFPWTRGSRTVFWTQHPVPDDRQMLSPSPCSEPALFFPNWHHQSHPVALL